MSQTQNYQAPQQGGFFDGSNVDEKVLDNFDPLPDGDHIMIVKNAEVKQSKNNPSTLMFAIEFEVCQGPKQGRKHFENFTFQHASSKQAVDIGKAKMKMLCLTILGRPTCGAPTELYGKPLTVRTKIKFNKEFGPQANLVKIGPPTGIVEAQRGAPAAQAGQQQAPHPAQQTGAPQNPNNQPARPDGSIPQPGDNDFVPF